MNCQPFMNNGTGTGTGHNQYGSHLQSQMSLDSEDGALDSEDQNQSSTTVLLRTPIKQMIISNQGFFFYIQFYYILQIKVTSLLKSEVVANS